MPAVQTPDIMHYSALSRMVNERKDPNNFLNNLIFPSRTWEQLTTEFAEYSIIYRKRKMAPYVHKNGTAIMIEGLEDGKAVIETPNIRIKRPLNLPAILFRREPGMAIFQSGGSAQKAAVLRKVAREVGELAALADEAEEVQAAQLLRGEINYEVADGAAFKLTLPRPATHDTTATVMWDQPTPGILHDFGRANRAINHEVGGQAQIALFGRNAVKPFLDDESVQKLLDTRNYTVGNIDLTRAIQDSGALYLGRIRGVQCWEYDRSAIMPDGSTFEMIRPDYVEFLNLAPRMQWTKFYGAIPDWNAFSSNAWTQRRFSKQWLQQDPSVRIALLHTRPLCFVKRPGAMVSMQVI
jgi:hypothetical protein